MEFRDDLGFLLDEGKHLLRVFSGCHWMENALHTSTFGLVKVCWAFCFKDIKS